MYRINFRTRGTRSSSPLARNSHRLSRLCAHPLNLSFSLSLSLSLLRFLFDVKRARVSSYLASLPRYAHQRKAYQRKMSQTRNNCIDFYAYPPITRVRNYCPGAVLSVPGRHVEPVVTGNKCVDGKIRDNVYLPVTRRLLSLNMRLSL